MSTPLVILACILALFTLVLIPFMMMKGDNRRSHGENHQHDDRLPRHDRQHHRTTHRKKKKR